MNLGHLLRRPLSCGCGLGLALCPPSFPRRSQGRRGALPCARCFPRGQRSPHYFRVPSSPAICLEGRASGATSLSAPVFLPTTVPRTTGEQGNDRSPGCERWGDGGDQGCHALGHAAPAGKDAALPCLRPGRPQGLGEPALAVPTAFWAGSQVTHWVPGQPRLGLSFLLSLAPGRALWLPEASAAPAHSAQDEGDLPVSTKDKGARAQGHFQERWLSRGEPGGVRPGVWRGARGGERVGRGAHPEGWRSGAGLLRPRGLCTELRPRPPLLGPASRPAHPCPAPGPRSDRTPRGRPPPRGSPQRRLRRPSGFL